MAALVNPHGGDLTAARARLGRTPLDFSANLNPLGLPGAVRAAAASALADSGAYPDPHCRALRAALALREGVDASRIRCGNGAADLIYRFAFAVRAQRVLISTPTFCEYAMAFEAAGAQVLRHALRPETGFALTEALLPLLEGVQALCLCNPNNPTGLTVDPAVLDALLDRCRELRLPVLLDECFVDFLDEPDKHTKTGCLDAHPTLTILKAFTKLYAMPGLRLGYALSGDEGLLSAMDASGPPWNVSNVAQAAGLAALSDSGRPERPRALIRAERAHLRAGLAALGAQVYGEANFLLFQAPPGLPGRMETEGILVRDCANFEGLGPGWVRVAVRNRAENDRLLAGLRRQWHG